MNEQRKYGIYTQWVLFSLNDSVICRKMVELESIMLNYINQRQKDKYHMCFLIYRNQSKDDLKVERGTIRMEAGKEREIGR
jgi:hypothetical protein